MIPQVAQLHFLPICKICCKVNVFFSFVNYFKDENPKIFFLSEKKDEKTLSVMKKNINLQTEKYYTFNKYKKYGKNRNNGRNHASPFARRQ